MGKLQKRYYPVLWYFDTATKRSWEEPGKVSFNTPESAFEHGLTFKDSMYHDGKHHIRYGFTNKVTSYYVLED
jgi:hypothetical protein